MFKKLITVKSIVTIILTLLVSYLAIIGKISGSEVITIYTTVIAFYFGVQSAKKEE
jgi:hypothetical protein